MKKSIASFNLQSAICDPQLFRSSPFALRIFSAFTLIELLVVVGIIGLLIGILLPSLKGARNSARNSQVKMQINSIAQALEKFNNDSDDYPESAKMKDSTEDSTLTPPAGGTQDDSTLYGAQALARAMVGKDLKGYVDRREARKFRPESDNPGPNSAWYYDDKTAGPYESDYPREDILLNDMHKFVSTAELPGSPPTTFNSAINTQFVIKDTFDYPILYYKANPKGIKLCNAYTTSNGPAGYVTYDPADIPFYNLLDNDIFTGSKDDVGGVNTSDELGWRFGASSTLTGAVQHEIGQLGNPVDPDDPSNIPAGHSTTFAKYIHDHKIEQAASSANKVLPYNKDSYLLISTGIDGIYGTADDLNNFQER